MMEPSGKSKESSSQTGGVAAGGKEKGPGLKDLDFSNTEIAFSHQDDEEIQKAARIFGLMNKHWLVGIGSKIGIAAVKMHLPFVESIVKNTIYEQFCGGVTLLDSKTTIDKLYSRGVFTVLDYGAEGKEKEEDFNISMNQIIRAIEFASRHGSVPMVTTKITGLARNELLEKKSRGEVLTEEERSEYSNVIKRIEAIAFNAKQNGMSVLVDAEETWLQPAIDELVEHVMAQYNTEAPTVYNTFQFYRKNQLKNLQSAYRRAREKGYCMGAKLVRGAYMEKEREEAEEQGYPSPIQPDKASTDKAYDQGLRFCVDRFEDLAFINATHNERSTRLLADLILEKGLPRHHEHIMFSQLMGMGDNLSFNLANAGFYVAKYMPYGPVKDVVPYLIRRAQENSSVSGDMTREYKLVLQELKRRGLQ